jgi:hypothetical protein
VHTVKAKFHYKLERACVPNKEERRREEKRGEERRREEKRGEERRILCGKGEMEMKMRER